MRETSIDEISAMLIYDPMTGSFSRRGPRHGRGFHSVGHAVPGKYTYIRVNKQRFAAHRLAWFMTCGRWPAADIDHINGDKHDNRLCNLREASRSLNNANTPGRAKSGFKGVVKIKNRYRAQITINRKPIRLGFYKTPELAHAAYVTAAKDAFGSFSRTN